ncbi:TPA: hypothetical protein ACIURA_004121, partial [Shigella flexneri]
MTNGQPAKFGSELWGTWLHTQGINQIDCALGFVQQSFSNRDRLMGSSGCSAQVCFSDLIPGQRGPTRSNRKADR